MNRSSSCHAIIVLFAAVVVTAVIPVCSEAILFQHKFAPAAYDGVGNVTNRLFTSGKSQALVSDGLGRLVRLTQRENPTNGFNWTAAYDALGRRMRTTQTPVVNGVTNSAELLTLDSYFDPEVEFLELAVGVNGSRTWKVLGLDGDEDYGGMQGVGGLEATIRESDGLITPVLNDYAGNVLATVSGGTANCRCFNAEPHRAAIRPRRAEACP